jgi:hypothetical protein
MSNQFAKELFTTPLKQLEELLSKARTQKQPGMFFYQNRGRNILFNVEALCRIFRITRSKKFYDKWYREFKMLEDIMGSMDHNESMWNEFSKYKDLKMASENLYQKRFVDIEKYFGEVLLNEGWLSGIKINEFRSELSEQSFPDDKKVTSEIATFIVDEMSVLEKEYKKGKLDISKLEEGVHEFRRKLRWVSIYAQVLNGMVQLRHVKVFDKAMEKYCTPEIMKSPFNVLPKAPQGIAPMYIQSQYFYALSWLIQQLGVIKDSGLKQLSFSDTLRNAKFKLAKDKEALMKSFEKKIEYTHDDISAVAEAMVDEFIYTDRILHRIERDIARSLNQES